MKAFRANGPANDKRRPQVIRARKDSPVPEGMAASQTLNLSEIVESDLEESSEVDSSYDWNPSQKHLLRRYVPSEDDDTSTSLEVSTSDVEDGYLGSDDETPSFSAISQRVNEKKERKPDRVVLKDSSEDDDEEEEEQVKPIKKRFKSGPVTRSFMKPAEHVNGIGLYRPINPKAPGVAPEEDPATSGYHTDENSYSLNKYAYFRPCEVNGNMHLIAACLAILTKKPKGPWMNFQMKWNQALGDVENYQKTMFKGKKIHEYENGVVVKIPKDKYLEPTECSEWEDDFFKEGRCFIIQDGESEIRFRLNYAWGQERAHYGRPHNDKFIRFSLRADYLPGFATIRQEVAAMEPKKKKKQQQPIKNSGGGGAKGKFAKRKIFKGKN